MVYFIVLSIMLNVFLIGYIIRSHNEMKHLTKQLKTVKTGSHIHLTSQIHTQEFHNLYLQLNLLMDNYKEKQYINQKAEQQLKMTIQNMAHDLRTPLTSSIGYMQMIKDSYNQDKNERYLHISLCKMEELKDMLEELFLYTKLTSESYQLDREEIPIYPIFANVLLSFYGLFQNNHQEPIVHFKDEAIQCLVNQEAIERVFQNIINNAIIHGKGDLRVYQKGHQIQFINTIKETCPPDIEHVFDRFYKADVSRNKTSSGLGLAIVKEFVEKMGGTVQARIEGNQFIIELLLDETRINKS